MDKRRSINTKFWDDTWIASISKDEKLLFIYLLTSPLSNLLGIYEITLKRISYDTGISQEEILNHLKGFERIRKAIFFNNWIVIFNHIKNQSFNPKMKIGAEQLFSKIPKELNTKLLEYKIIGYDTLSNGIDRIEQYEREEEREEEEEVEVKFFNPMIYLSNGVDSLDWDELNEKDKSKYSNAIWDILINESETWIERLIKDYKIDRIIVIQQLETFIKEQVLKDTIFRGVKKLKDHFVNVFKIFVKENNKPIVKQGGCAR